ncbi:MAG TPA: hypothetical protein PLA69_04985 [Flavobacterium sp.]|nr:hypothetical protein [Flavobacterium sp.]
MKKLFLFVAVAAMSFSCSSDDNKGGGGSSADSVTFTFNGQAKSLTNVIVDEEGEGTDVYPGVTANIGTSTDNIVSFATYRGDVGADAIFGFSFIIDGQTYFPNGNLTNIIQTNNGNTLKGSFSGTLLDMEGNEYSVTNGSFDIKY